MLIRITEEKEKRKGVAYSGRGEREIVREIGSFSLDSPPGKGRGKKRD